VRILEREYGATGVFRLYGDVEERIAALRSLSPDEEEEICALAGHVPFGLGRVAGRETQAFTLLRHPVDRVISHYFYVLERRDEPVHADALEGVSCLADYVVRSPIARLVNNGMTRFLGGDAFGEWTPASNEHLSISKRRIHDGEILVGLQERFRESVAFFRQRFGWGWPVVEHTNHTVGRPPISDVEPTTIALIEAHNALDLELYDMARTVFEQRGDRDGRARR
jgi:hypothetical protein